MQETKTLTISNPPQFGVIIERNDKGLEHSIFKDVYDEAFERATDIIQANGGNNPNGSGPHEQFSNTVISFVGKRGTGKSTAMCSFSSFLSSSKFDKIKSDRARTALTGKCFYCLDAIDSVQLGTKETIIGRISAAMFKEYENMTNCPMSISVEQKRDFIKQVNTVNKYAVMYHNGEWFKQNDSLLTDTCHVSTLRSEMQKLVYSYLKLKSRDYEVKDKYLVVSIDDLDMGIENSYAIMEEIRKFLCIKNIIVLVTLRMDQVHSALRSKFEQQLNSKHDYGDNRILIDDLAYRYIEKLFPYSRQIQMPTLSLNNLKTWKADFDIEIPPENEKTILPSVLHLIWKKTLIIPVCNSDGDHFLIPRNLRSLCNLVVFLRNLPDVYTDAPTDIGTGASTNIDAKIPIKDKIQLQNNLAAFSRYLVFNVRSYERGSISYEDRAFSEKLIAIISDIEFTPLDKINSKIVGEILYYLYNNENGDYYKKLFDRKGDNNDLDTGNILLNASLENNCISLGDLIYVLGEIDNKTRCRYIKHLIEVIRTFWSAKMTEEYYCNSIDNIALSSRFNKGVGKLIVNPDVGFFETENSGFTKQIPNSTIETFKTKELFQAYIGELGDERWRHKTNTSSNNVLKEIRTKEKYKTNTNVCYHPLCAITAFLYEDNNQLRRVKKDIYDTQHKTHWIALPLYSFDFVYRFVEFLSDILVSRKTKAYHEIKNFELLVDEMVDAVQCVIYSRNNFGISYHEDFVPLKNYISEKEATRIKNYMDAFKEAVSGIVPKSTDQNVFFDKVKKARKVSRIFVLLKDLDSYNIPDSKKDELRTILEKHENSDIPLEQIKAKIKEIKDK